MDGSSCALRRNVNAGLLRSETSVVEGNYMVNPEANGKNNNPIWILAAELIVPRVGGGEEGGHEGRIQERMQSEGEERKMWAERTHVS